jgi:maleate isomerase
VKPLMIKVGLIVPSSNVTMEREIPELLRRQCLSSHTQFSVHASRVTMRQVQPDELQAMNLELDRAAAQIADAECDVVLYACLVAVMAEGRDAHRSIEARLASTFAAAERPVRTITSAGALVRTLGNFGYRRVALVTPYIPSLTETVVDYVRASGVEVCSYVGLNVPDNMAVGRLDPAELPTVVERLDLADADALVLSACVQMPSLEVIDEVEQRFGLPVVTAATATVREALSAVGEVPDVSGAGAALASTAPRVASGVVR